MLNETLSLDYRKFVAELIQKLRIAVFNSSGKTRFPTDAYIAYMIGLTPTAFSNLCTCKASASGVTLSIIVASLSSFGVSVSFPDSFSRV